MTNEGILYHLKSTEETFALGKKLGVVLEANDIIALHGDLGAGKTTLTQGIARGLDVKDFVASPTFIIINEYAGRLPLFHIDLYRLNQEVEIENLGITEYFQRGGVCVIEWAEKLGELKPAQMHEISLKILGDNEREICVSSDLTARLTV
ncbi:tRNA (adenosine(37)-N6)-threonylcarbamoyltransferase complex ATPase subunit type 1 TsaE [Candidatus Saganbacteria bacterium]|nr:tRNA (adenosine(37)-N6)-threonylcarbamoyltransferase complex ATPase subunit type 1 TsaE [Candidatus Saganbacteria bacterium]